MSRLLLGNISKSFDGIDVLCDVSFEVRPGEVVALLGENGAGKSTLSSIIAGIYSPDSGNMKWNGDPYLPASPGHAIAAGIGLIHQETNLLPYLSIYENIFLGRLLTKHGRIDRARMKQIADTQLARLGLAISSDTQVRELSIAAMQQVEIAKALSLHSQLLILDEPTASLGTEEVRLLFQQIKALQNDGVSFIYISHRLDEIPHIADRVVVLRDGSLISQYDTARVPTRHLISDMVGRKFDTIFPDSRAPSQNTVLEVEGIQSSTYQFENICFSVHAGEILGIAGIIGAGRTELARCIAGIDTLAGGHIHLNGTRVHFTSPKDAIQHGIVFIQEDRKYKGLVLEQDVKSNVLLGNFDKMTFRGWCRKKNITHYTNNIIKKFRIKSTSSQEMKNLSGGNQQKVVIGKWISRNPTVVILDEPTRGIDVGARYEIYTTITQLACDGAAIILISSDIEEVLGLAHRVLVLCKGVQRGVIEKGPKAKETIMELATSVS